MYTLVYENTVGDTRVKTTRVSHRAGGLRAVTSGDARSRQRPTDPYLEGIQLSTVDCKRRFIEPAYFPWHQTGAPRAGYAFWTRKPEREGNRTTSVAVGQQPTFGRLQAFAPNRPRARAISRGLTACQGQRPAAGTARQMTGCGGSPTVQDLA